MTAPLTLVRSAVSDAPVVTKDFRVGQIWTDQRGVPHQTIVAITCNTFQPIVTQDDSGDVFAYSPDGRFLPNNASEFDLVTLIEDAPVADPSIDADGL